MIDLIAALDDPNLFGPWFAGPSWKPWRAVLKAASGHALDDDELRIFREVAHRDPPLRRVREVWIAAGRRAGKDSVASALAAHAAGFRDYGAILRPGELASVLCLAVDKLQAKIVLRYTKAFFDRIPMLAELVTRETADGLDLSTQAELSVIASNFRSVRGRSIALAVLDECAFWRDELSASPDVETYNAILPGLVTVPDAMLLGISSPYRRAGLIYQKWRDYFGKSNDDVLVIQAPSRTLNPTLPQRVIDEALARDPAAARAEWLGEWRDDISGFLSRELIDAAVDRGVVVRPRVPGVTYRAAADPSGGVSDAFTAAVSHAEGDTVILDCLIDIPSPANPAESTARIAAVLKSYGVSEVTADRYSAGWSVDAFARHGVRLVHSERDRSAIYIDALPLFTSGRVRLLDNPKLVSQFANLERRPSPSGRDRIDHPAGANCHDDAANSVALALVLCAGSAEPGFLGFVRWQAAGEPRDQIAPPPVSAPPSECELNGEWVKLRAPLGTSHAVGWRSGQEYVVDPNGFLIVHRDDAGPLRRAGFVDIKKDIAT